MSIRAAALVATYFLLLTLMARGAAGESHFELGPPMRLRDAEQGSLLLRTEFEGVFLPAPVLETEVRIRVAGLLARATVTQRFHNPTQEWLEGVYVFPLPDTAAVDGLRMIVGERIVEGRIKEREEAKRLYTEARAQGKKASLVEQERPNIFTTSVANIGPQENIEIVIEYQEDLRYQGGRFELRFPMVVGPRFVPGAEGIDGFDGTGWGRNTPEVPDAERITPPVIPPDQGPINPVRIRVDLDAGVPLSRVTSPSDPGREAWSIALARRARSRDRRRRLRFRSRVGARSRRAPACSALHRGAGWRSLRAADGDAAAGRGRPALADVPGDDLRDRHLGVHARDLHRAGAKRAAPGSGAAAAR